MRLHRLCRRAHRPLDGEGARLYGGRWSSPGRPAIYTSRTLSLAALEYLVHIDPALAPRDLVALELEIPDPLLTTLDPARLPKGWRGLPADPKCAALGDAWLESCRSALLAVPSVPSPESVNYLFNPLHKDAAGLVVVWCKRLRYDKRLFQIAVN